MTPPELRVGVIGTSWWADAMYLPALTRAGPQRVSAVCGRDPERTRAFAERWGVEAHFTDPVALLDSGRVDAVVVATTNDSHHPIAMAALERGLHVLCEKPLALDHAQAAEMAALADEAGVTTLVPFTYRYMPTTRHLKSLVDDGFLGTPYHLALRYYAGFGRDGSRYSWRFDADSAGAGALGDIGSHFLHLAEWLYGPIAALCSDLGRQVDRPARDPQGRDYRPAEDSAALLLRFANGAHGTLHATTLAFEDTPFGQVHEFDLHGSGGTLRQVIDWDERQQILGARVGEGASREIEVPERVWEGAPRTPVTDTYRHVFREQGRMVREWAAAAAAGERVRPDFADGARVQRLIEAGIESDAQGCWVSVEP